MSRGQSAWARGVARIGAAVYCGAISVVHSTPRQNEEALLRFLRVLAEAESWLVEPSNRVEATAMLAQISGLSTAEAREAAAVVLDQRQTLARAGELNPAGVKALLELIGEATPDRKPSGGPERYVDESYLGRARP